MGTHTTAHAGKLKDPTPAVMLPRVAVKLNRQLETTLVKRATQTVSSE